jgi:hypothetical protein
MDAVGLMPNASRTHGINSVRKCARSMCRAAYKRNIESLVTRACILERTGIEVFQIGQLRPLRLPHPVKMKKSELTPKQVFSAACPTCGVGAGKRCLMKSGIPRTKPHVDRKFAAIEAIETK